MINVVTLNTELGELFGVAFEDTGFLLPTLHSSQDLAERGMVDYANSRIAAIDAAYTRVDEEGNSLRPGKRSNADKLEREAMVSVVESFESGIREQDVINRYLATLAPEVREALLASQSAS